MPQIIITKYRNVTPYTINCSIMYTFCLEFFNNKSTKQKYAFDDNEYAIEKETRPNKYAASTKESKSNKCKHQV